MKKIEENVCDEDILKLPDDNDFFSLTVDGNMVILKIFDRSIIDDIFESAKEKPDYDSLYSSIPNPFDNLLEKIFDDLVKEYE